MIDMQQKLQEAISAFEKLLSPRDIAQAKAAWEDLATTHEGQKMLLGEAKAGNIDAINYLYIKLTPLISSLFWRNFLGPNPNFRRQRINNGDQFVFISLVYQTLMTSYLKNLPREEALAVMKANATRANPRRQISDEEIEKQLDEVSQIVSPLNTFDPDAYSEDTDLISKFGYYLTAAIKNESRKYNATEMMGGIAAKKMSDEEKATVKNVSYEAHFENDEETAAGGSDFLGTEDKDAWSQFVADEDLDSGKAPTLRQVLKDFLVRGGKFDVAAVAAAHGVTPMTIRNRLGQIAPVLDKHGITKDAFGRLITSQGGKTLAASL